MDQVARFLLAQGGKQKYLDFLTDGLRDENWPRAVKQHYGQGNLLTLQNQWLDWVRQGSPPLGQPSPVVLASASDQSPSVYSSQAIFRGQSTDEVASEPGEPSRLSRDTLQELPFHVVSNNSSSSGEANSGPPLLPVDITPAVPQTTQPQQVTRPQPPQQARQVILEWSRSSSVAPPPTAFR